MRKETTIGAVTTAAAAWSSEDDCLELLGHDPSSYRHGGGRHSRRDVTAKPGSLVMPSTGNGSTCHNSEPPSPTRSKAAVIGRPYRTGGGGGMINNNHRRLTSTISSKDLINNDSVISLEDSSDTNIENVHPLTRNHRISLASTSNAAVRAAPERLGSHHVQSKSRLSGRKDALNMTDVVLESNHPHHHQHHGATRVMNETQQLQRGDSRNRMHRSSSMGRQAAGSREKGSRTICVCGASAYYERERFVLLKEKNRLHEESLRLKDHYRKLADEQKELNDEANSLEQRRIEAEKLRQTAEDMMLAAEEEASANEQLKKSLVRQKEQLDKNRETLGSQMLTIHSNREELERKSAQLEKMHCELMSKKTELDERTIQLKKTNLRLEHQQTKIKHETDRLDALRGELEAESDRLNEERSALLQQEHALEERRRSLVAREGTLNEELSGLDDQKLCLERRAQELSQKEMSWKNTADEMRNKLLNTEAELNKLQRTLELEKSELERARTEFDIEQKRLSDALQADKDQHSRQIAIDREDLQSQVKLEKEWVKSERDNIEKMKELTRMELQAEKDHTEEFLKQLRAKNAEQIESERAQWQAEEKRLTDERTKQMNELQKFREDLKVREAKLTQSHHQLMESKRKLVVEQDRFSERMDAEEERLAEAKVKIQADQTELRERMMAVKDEETDLTMRSEKLKEAEERMEQTGELLNRKREAVETEMQAVRDRARVLAQREAELVKKNEECADKEIRLNEREEKLTTVEARAKWLQSVYREVKEHQSTLLAEKEQLEWEKKRLEDGRQLLEHRKKRVADQIQALQDNERGPSTPLRPLARCRTQTPKEFKKALPSLQINMSSFRLAKKAQFSPQGAGYSQDNSAFVASQPATSETKSKASSVASNRPSDEIVSVEKQSVPAVCNPVSSKLRPRSVELVRDATSAVIDPYAQDRLLRYDSLNSPAAGYMSDSDTLNHQPSIDWMTHEIDQDESPRDDMAVPQVKREDGKSQLEQIPSYDDAVGGSSSAYSTQRSRVSQVAGQSQRSMCPQNDGTSPEVDGSEYIMSSATGPEQENASLSKATGQHTYSFLPRPTQQQFEETNQSDDNGGGSWWERESCTDGQRVVHTNWEDHGQAISSVDAEEDIPPVTERTCFSMGSALAGEDDEYENDKVNRHLSHYRDNSTGALNRTRSMRDTKSVSTAPSGAGEWSWNKENDGTVKGQQGFSRWQSGFPDHGVREDYAVPTSTRSLMTDVSKPHCQFQSLPVDDESKGINRHRTAVGLISEERYLKPFHEV